MTIKDNLYCTVFGELEELGKFYVDGEPYMKIPPISGYYGPAINAINLENYGYKYFISDSPIDIKRNIHEVPFKNMKKGEVFLDEYDHVCIITSESGNVFCVTRNECDSIHPDTMVTPVDATLTINRRKQYDN